MSNIRNRLPNLHKEDGWRLYFLLSEPNRRRGAARRGGGGMIMIGQFGRRRSRPQRGNDTRTRAVSEAGSPRDRQRRQRGGVTWAETDPRMNDPIIGVNLGSRKIGPFTHAPRAFWFAKPPYLMVICLSLRPPDERYTERKVN